MDELTKRLYTLVESLPIKEANKTGLIAEIEARGINDRIIAKVITEIDQYIAEKERLNQEETHKMQGELTREVKGFEDEFKAFKSRCRWEEDEGQLKHIRKNIQEN